MHACVRVGVQGILHKPTTRNELIMAEIESFSQQLERCKHTFLQEQEQSKSESSTPLPLVMLPSCFTAINVCSFIRCFVGVAAISAPLPLSV